MAMLYKLETKIGNLQGFVFSPAELRCLKSTFDGLWKAISFAYPDANSEWIHNARESLAGAIMTIFQENRKKGGGFAQTPSWLEYPTLTPEQYSITTNHEELPISSR